MLLRLSLCCSCEHCSHGLVLPVTTCHPISSGPFHTTVCSTYVGGTLSLWMWSYHNYHFTRLAWFKAGRFQLQGNPCIIEGCHLLSSFQAWNRAITFCIFRENMILEASVAVICCPWYNQAWKQLVHGDSSGGWSSPVASAASPQARTCLLLKLCDCVHFQSALALLSHCVSFLLDLEPN